MTNNELNTKADFNPAKHQHDAGFRNPEPAHDADKSDVVFLSMAQAAKMTGYHQDYLGQMARSGKLEAIKVGRNWQTTKLAIDKMLGRVPKEEPVPVQKVDEPKVSAPVEIAKTVASIPAPAPIQESIKPVVVETPKPLVSEPLKVVAAQVTRPLPPAPPVPPKNLAIKISAPVSPQPPKPVITQATLEKNSDPVKAASKIPVPPAPPVAPVSKPVAINISQPQPDAEKVEPKISVPQPVRISAPVAPAAPVVSKMEPEVIRKNTLSKKVHIKHYPVSKDAGPNLQELIASYNHEELVQYTDIGIENREKLLRWNKIAPEFTPKKQSFTPNRVKEFANHYPEKSESVVEKKVRPVWTYATVGVTTLVLLAAGYFASTYMSPTQNPSTNAFLAPERMVAGEATSVQDPITGKAIIPVGVTEFVVKDEGVSSGSTILITLRENFGGRYWIAGQRKGEFVIKLSEPIKTKTPFDYMILADEEEGAE